MLIDLDVERVLRPAGIAGPHRALLEAHPVERLRRQPGTGIGQLLGVGKGAQGLGDHSFMAADVPRGADMAGRVGPANDDAIAGPEEDWRAVSGRRVNDPPSLCLATSSIRRPSSSAVIR